MKVRVAWILQWEGRKKTERKRERENENSRSTSADCSVLMQNIFIGKWPFPFCLSRSLSLCSYICPCLPLSFQNSLIT